MKSLDLCKLLLTVLVIPVIPLTNCSASSEVTFSLRIFPLPNTIRNPDIKTKDDCIKGKDTKWVSQNSDDADYNYKIDSDPTESLPRDSIKNVAPSSDTLSSRQLIAGAHGENSRSP